MPLITLLCPVRHSDTAVSQMFRGILDWFFHCWAFINRTAVSKKSISSLWCKVEPKPISKDSRTKEGFWEIGWIVNVDIMENTLFQLFLTWGHSSCSILINVTTIPFLMSFLCGYVRSTEQVLLTRPSPLILTRCWKYGKEQYYWPHLC